MVCTCTVDVPLDEVPLGADAEPALPALQKQCTPVAQGPAYHYITTAVYQLELALAVTMRHAAALVADEAW